MGLIGSIAGGVTSAVGGALAAKNKMLHTTNTSRPLRIVCSR